jgi:dihydroorotate dehydrogenase
VVEIHRRPVLQSGGSLGKRHPPRQSRYDAAVPDWSYRTVLRPLLLALGAERSRRLATATLRTLARAPLGLQAIDFLGHMRADARLRTRAGGLELAGPIALGALIDPRGDALAAFARFGVGMIEAGPVLERSVDRRAVAGPEWRVDLERRTIDSASALTVSLDELAANLERADPRVPVCVRIAAQDGAAVRRIVERLQKHVALFVADPANVHDARGGRPVLSAETIHEDAAGIWLRGDPERVRAVRAALPDGAIVIASGATQPCEVRELLNAGADVVAIDAGLVCSGPGLIKRCNEALLSLEPAASPPEPLTLDAARRSWFWALLMGVAMFLGGVMAVAIASTRIVLPYDESLGGLTRAQMLHLNPRLLPFMAHDRISLAGTMLSIGIFYAALAWSGIRRGAHWAYVTVIVSALAGFLSFFSFLGFGYFDPFHAFVTVILTQCMLLCLVLPPSPPQAPVAEWQETAAWRRGQWGQLLFIVLGIGLTGAGVVMTIIGCTRVFVDSDLVFMRPPPCSSATRTSTSSRSWPMTAPASAGCSSRTASRSGCPPNGASAPAPAGSGLPSRGEAISPSPAPSPCTSSSATTSRCISPRPSPAGCCGTPRWH